MRAEKISPSTKTSGGDSAGEVRERDAEAAIFVLMDHGDVVLAHDGLGFGALSIVQAAAVVLAGAASAAVVAVWVCCSLQSFSDPSPAPCASPARRSRSANEKGRRFGGPSSTFCRRGSDEQSKLALHAILTL
jgi:hypothetical protein